jgi:hypothetical protein
MNLRTLVRPRHRAEGHRRPPLAARRPALLLSTAAAGAVLVNVLAGGEPPAQADAPPESVSIAQQLGITADSSSTEVDAETVQPLEQLAASRAERESDQTAAAQAQAAADQAEKERRAAEEAARVAAEQAAAEEAARVAAEEAAAAAAPAAAPAPSGSGSFQDYALGQLGGDAGQFSCLESLWGKESGWNPDAQNPSSTAYGIPQFLDSTWASTGIAKTSDGYRQIDAGLIYINSRYGSPCGAWSHSQSTGWY